MLMSLAGCTDYQNSDDEKSFLKGSEEIAFIKSKDVYTCDNDEFFFIEDNRTGHLNFIYDSFSTSLTKKPSKDSYLYSDGVYNISFSKNNAEVSFENEAFLSNCKKRI